MSRLGRRIVAVLGVTAFVVAVAGANPPPARADQAGWATFSAFDGSSRAYTARMEQQPTGFPAAEIVTNSVGGTSVGIQNGQSTYLSATTDVGRKYGSSRNRPYLNLRPNNANGPPESVTTYLFERPTPAAGWTFVLGDIDADAVEVSATDADGRPVGVSDLGFRSTFNYCSGRVCSPNDDEPSWNATTGILTGNSKAEDTNGASAWFEPRVALSTLTFSYSRRAGFPVYQAWFSALKFDLTGSVNVPAGVDADDLELILYDPSGAIVGRTRTDANGDYRFPGLATYDGYRVALVRPTGLISDDPLEQTVDLNSGDATADFTLRRLVPRAASGTVTADGQGQPGVTVTLRDSTGTVIETTITGPDGSYVFDRIPTGTGYTMTPTVPDGFLSATPTRRTFDVLTGSDSPVTGLDFALAREPTGTASGRITQEDSGAAEPGVLVTVRGPGGAVYEARSDENGRWELPDLPPGDYTATVTAPDGSTVDGVRSRTFTIAADGSEATGLDFVIDVPAPPASYRLSGRVTDEAGEPVRGVAVTITPPGGGVPYVVRTDADGRYVVVGLPAANGYRVSIRVPKGTTADPSSVRVNLTADRGDVDFVLAAVRAPSASPEPTAASPSAGAADGGLADTGGQPIGLAALGSLLVVTALLVRRRSVSNEAASTGPQATLKSSSGAWRQ